ncbi:MAG: PspC domain-containing protein [Thermoleophilaceae bacterium]
MDSMASAASPVRAVRRDPDRRVIAGVCAGIARYFGVDPLVVRIAFIAAAAAGGVGVVVYAAAWLLMPAGSGAPARFTVRGDRAAVEVALGSALLLASLLLAMRGIGLWVSDAVAWPLVLVAVGGALLWRQSLGGRAEQDAAAAGGPAEAVVAEPAETRAAVVSRTGIGAALVVAAGVVFLEATGSLGAARDAVLAALVAAVVLALIFAPWILRLVRSRDAERAERIRSQERAEMAAHLHDSVLQTLALVQRRADDPSEVSSLARRQERELRAWLSGRTALRGERRLIAALEEVAGEVERDRGVEVDVVAVGDLALDERGEALVAAAREAMLNAAKFGGGSTVDVYAEASDGRMQVFVRDRGPGFDPAALPPDRRGVRESIVGRMERNGGRATVSSSPGGAGTEVELVMEEPDR